MQAADTIKIHHGGRIQTLSPEAVDTMTYELIGQLTRWALHDIPGLRVSAEETIDIASDIYLAYLTEDIRGKYNAGLGPWHLFIKTFVRRRVIDRVRKTARNWKNTLISLHDANPTEVQASLQDAEESNTAYTSHAEPVSRTPAWSELPLSMRRRMLTAYRAGWLPAQLVSLYKEHLTAHTRPRRSAAPVAAAPTDAMAPLAHTKRRRTAYPFGHLKPGLADHTPRRRWAWQFIPPRPEKPPIQEDTETLWSAMERLNERRQRRGDDPLSYMETRDYLRYRRYTLERWLHMTSSMDFLSGGSDFDRQNTNSWHMRHAPKDWEHHMHAVVPPFEIH